MVTEPEEVNWPSNYFNYFTETEQSFQRARGTALFLMSPLDWALVESWKNAGVPLEAVVRGIDAAFEKWRSKKSRTQMVNSLAFCSQAVLTEAKILSGTAIRQPSPSPLEAPFSLPELEQHLQRNAEDLRGLEGYEEIADALQRMLEQSSVVYGDLEELEQRLTALEEKMIAMARSRVSEEDLFQARRELDLQLRPYRRKMSAEQLAMLEKQYLERRLLEAGGLPRLSLFYLR